MNDEATYICGACGEEIVVPIDFSQGEEQEYVEDCPVCCQANVIHVEIDAEGEARVWSELEQQHLGDGVAKPPAFPLSSEQHLPRIWPKMARSSRPLPLPPVMPKPDSVDPIVSLRHRAFLIYLIGGLISNAGSQMRIVAVQWEFTLRESDPRRLALYLGYIGLTLVVPVLLFALPAGEAADRFSRRWLILIAQVGLAFCGVGLAWASWAKAPIFLIYVLLFGTGTFRALGWPAASAIVPGLVPSTAFTNAATWRSNAYQLASTLGPLAGGLLLAWWSPVIVFLIDAASSLILAGCMLFVRPRAQERVVEPRSWKALMQGIHFLRRQPVILSTMTLDMVAVLFGGVVALLPLFAIQFFGDREQQAVALGWMRAMPAVGSILMGFIIALRPPIKRGGRAILITVVVFGVATIVFGISKSFVLSLAALFVLGAADNISVVIRQTVLQLMTPDSMRGRVTAVSVIFIGSSNELGEFESGVAASVLGLVPSVVFGGVMTLVTVGVVSIIWPELAQLGNLAHLKPPDSPEGEAIT